MGIIKPPAASCSCDARMAGWLDVGCMGCQEMLDVWAMRNGQPIHMSCTHQERCCSNLQMCRLKNAADDVITLLWFKVY
jgi:hypothetical protein